MKGKRTKVEKMVTVILPVYNGEKFIQNALESAINQTYMDYEILVIDNDSTDNTKKIVRKYVEEYPAKVKYIYNKGKTAGDSHNAGIENCQSKYVCFLHVDDMFNSEIIERLVVAAEQNCSDMSACGMCLKKDGMIVDHTELLPWSYGNGEIQLYASSFVLARLFRRDFLKKNNIRFPDKNTKVEDMPFITQCGYMAKNIVTIPYIGYVYIYNTESVSHSKSYHFGASYENTPLDYIEMFIRKLKNVETANDFTAYEYQVLRLFWYLSFVYIRFGSLKSIYKVNIKLACILRENFKEYWKNPYMKFSHPPFIRENSKINKIMIRVYTVSVRFHFEVLIGLMAGVVSNLYQILMKGKEKKNV